MAFSVAALEVSGSQVDARTFRSRDAMQLESDQARGGLKGGLPISEGKLSLVYAGMSAMLAGNA